MDSIELKGQTYQYAFLNEENFSDLSYLFQQVYQLTISTSVLKKKYKPLDAFSRCFGCFMYTEEGVPISFQGAIPFRLSNGGEEVFGAQSCDSMTVSGYAGRGIFSFLALRVDDLLASCNIKFIYGFPNQNSEGILFGKLGWLKTERMTFFSMNTGSLPLLSFLKLLPAARNAIHKRALKKLNSFGEIQTAFENSERGESKLTVIHDHAFFNYKKEANKAIIRFQNGIVWLKISEVIMVGDLAFSEPERVKDLLNELKQLARKIGIARVIFQCQAGGRSHALLKPLLEEKISWQVGLKPFDDEIDLKEFVATYGDLDTF